MNRYTSICFVVFTLTLFSCVESTPKNPKVESQSKEQIFEKGTRTSKQKFVGDVYMNLLFLKIQYTLQNRVA